MTRINQIPVEELSDQHLIREYNEIPRFIKQDINIDDVTAIRHNSRFNVFVFILLYFIVVS